MADTRGSDKQSRNAAGVAVGMGRGATPAIAGQVHHDAHEARYDFAERGLSGLTCFDRACKLCDICGYFEHLFGLLASTLQKP